MLTGYYNTIKVDGKSMQVGYRTGDGKYKGTYFFSIGNNEIFVLHTTERNARIIAELLAKSYNKYVNDHKQEFEPVRYDDAPKRIQTEIV